jgi:integrase
MQESRIREFVADWRLSGRSPRTAREYVRYLNNLNSSYQNPSLPDVKEWLQASSGVSVRRKKAQAVRAFGRWCEDVGIEELQWWRKVPLVSDESRPQKTVSAEVYREVLDRCRNVTDKALVELLWSTGLRRSEIERLRIENVDFANGYLVVVTSKSGKPRVVPVSPTALRALRRVIGSRVEGSVFGLTGNAIRLRLSRLGAPSAHAWRRGWAVHSLRAGVSEASLKSAAGWSSGAMVSRYTLALASEMSLAEFGRVWSVNSNVKL